MMTHVPNNRFNMIHFQLFNRAGEYVSSFGEGYSEGVVSGEYVHDLPSGYYILRLKGNTNRADERLQIEVFMEKGELNIDIT